MLLGFATLARPKFFRTFLVRTIRHKDAQDTAAPRDDPGGSGQ